MVDHYVRHRDRNVFFAILAALLTTIGALVIIFFLPEGLQKDLYDFAWIVIINLTVSLIVALLFVPALIERLKYGKGSDKSDSSDGSEKSEKSLVLSAYSSYIRFAQRFRWLLIVILTLAFGIPLFALPDKLGEKDKEEPEWYESLYNSTLGSDFFVHTCKPAMSE